MGNKVLEFFGRYLSPIIWVLFLFLYIEARFVFRLFDVEGFTFSYKVAYHIGFFVPLGIFLWRKEFSILNIAVILILLAFIPEGYQYYKTITVPLAVHLFDFSLNLAGGIIGIGIGMLWTLRELMTR